MGSVLAYLGRKWERKGIGLASTLHTSACTDAGQTEERVCLNFTVLLEAVERSVFRGPVAFLNAWVLVYPLVVGCLHYFPLASGKALD